MESSISLQELHSFHSIDRKLFSRLVFTLQRSIAESLLLIATWMWLEDKGFPNMIAKMERLSDTLVNALANEAALCLTAMESTFLSVPPNGGLPLHTNFMEREITLQYFMDNKYTAICGIRNYLTTTCSRIFVDIIQQMLRQPLNLPINVPGFPHPLFGGVTIMPFGFPTERLWGWNSLSNVTESDRTLFLTFSRGFPVSEEEVMGFFTATFGDCVESVHMQENPPNQQCLYARLVMVSVNFVDQVLRGERVAKFGINGKHIWARKYQLRD